MQGRWIYGPQRSPHLLEKPSRSKAIDPHNRAIPVGTAASRIPRLSADRDATGACTQGNAPHHILLAIPFNLSPVGTGAYQFRRADRQRYTGYGSQAAFSRRTYAKRPEGKDGFAMRQNCFSTAIHHFNDAIAAFQRGRCEHRRRTARRCDPAGLRH